MNNEWKMKFNKCVGLSKLRQFMRLVDTRIPYGLRNTSFTLGHISVDIYVFVLISIGQCSILNITILDNNQNNNVQYFQFD